MHLVVKEITYLKMSKGRPAQMPVVKLLLQKLQLKTINPVLNWFEICTLKTL